MLNGELFKTMTAEQYHAHPAVSNSRLGDLIDDPRIYHYKWLSGKYRPKRKQYFDVGSAVHESLLLNQSSWVTVPVDVLGKNGARNTKAYREWAADNYGKMQLTLEEEQTVLGCTKAVKQDRAAGRLLAIPGEPELPMSAEYMGLDCKCRFDKLSKTIDGHLILDIKTTGGSSTASSFVKSITSYGYHRQAAFYKQIAQLNGLHVANFIFIVVSTTEPYTVDVFNLDDEFLDLGMQEIDRAMTELIRRTEQNDWSGRGAGQIVSLSPPGYLKYKGDYAL